MADSSSPRPTPGSGPEPAPGSGPDSARDPLKPTPDGQSPNRAPLASLRRRWWRRKFLPALLRFLGRGLETWADRLEERVVQVTTTLPGELRRDWGARLLRWRLAIGVRVCAVLGSWWGVGLAIGVGLGLLAWGWSGGNGGLGGDGVGGWSGGNWSGGVNSREVDNRGVGSRGVENSGVENSEEENGGTLGSAGAALDAVGFGAEGKGSIAAEGDRGETGWATAREAESDREDANAAQGMAEAENVNQNTQTGPSRRISSGKSGLSLDFYADGDWSREQGPIEATEIGGVGGNGAEGNTGGITAGDFGDSGDSGASLEPLNPIGVTQGDRDRGDRDRGDRDRSPWSLDILEINLNPASDFSADPSSNFKANAGTNASPNPNPETREDLSTGDLITVDQDRLDPGDLNPQSQQGPEAPFQANLPPLVSPEIGPPLPPDPIAALTARLTTDLTQWLRSHPAFPQPPTNSPAPWLTAIQPDFEHYSLRLVMAPGWSRFTPAQQEQWAKQLQACSHRLQFQRWELWDSEQQLLARSPVVGQKPLIFRRSSR